MTGPAACRRVRRTPRLRASSIPPPGEKKNSPLGEFRSNSLLRPPWAASHGHLGGAKPIDLSCHPPSGSPSCPGLLHHPARRGPRPPSSRLFLYPQTGFFFPPGFRPAPRVLRAGPPRAPRAGSAPASGWSPSPRRWSIRWTRRGSPGARAWAPPTARPRTATAATRRRRATPSKRDRGGGLR